MYNGLNEAGARRFGRLPIANYLQIGDTAQSATLRYRSELGTAAPD
jgi:hypothetical protein